MRFVAIVCLAIFIFSGCAGRVDLLNYKANLPQNSTFYLIDSSDEVDLGANVAQFNLDSNLDSSESKTQKELKKQYLKRYFSVWEDNFHAPKKNAMFWAIYEKNGFDESKKPINADFFKALVESMNINSYPSLRKKAIMVKTANIRALPTIKPRFSKIDGYPFDRWQNSLIFAYTPIIVLHSTKNKEWLLVQSSFVSGWVKADEVAFMSDSQVREMKGGEFVLPMSDKIPLHHNGAFLQNARVGMLLLRESKKGESTKIIAYKRDMNGNAVKIRVDFDKKQFAPFPLPFSEANIAQMIERVGAENYGWGGMYENRDCSSFIRDIFTNVGIWLPRNSKAQVEWGKRKNGGYMELPDDNDEKIATLLAHAKPFRTIIWLKGHIMLYIGAIAGNPIVAHQVWGISGGGEVEIFSSVSITTLTPKIDFDSVNIVKNDGDSKTLLDRIKAINIVW